MKNHFLYQDQNSQLTLGEGLADYYQAHPAIQSPERLAAASADLFRAHDTCHVIFGLDTTLVDEALTDLRTMLGTDVGVGNYVQYLRKNPDAKKIFRELGYFRVVLATTAVFPRFLRHCGFIESKGVYGRGILRRRFSEKSWPSSEGIWDHGDLTS